ncbi:Sec-independent protein translocase subunit TatA [Xylanimonas protaetiae]|uniref:Sec-independent protein translocase protein TatA n=1 Tax=Xylanimonas protaetiae TaxID=2509457 RepID=A0A4P6F7X8_9MICO|nr:Sec-independent protein translocase subunit TatA [Xylanimonas protaetiae]QAY71912.1 Sec-independent protein translocase subunit TatA [Xylanimonas protaetiae]
MGALRPVHILILVVVLLLLFGARRLPDLAQSVGQSLKVFRKEVKELRDDVDPRAPEPPDAGDAAR